MVSCLFLGVCAVNGLLYVVGGDDGSCNLSTVEYYNPTTDKWTVVSSCMSTGRSYAGNVYIFLFFFKQTFYSITASIRNLTKHPNKVLSKVKPKILEWVCRI